MAEFKIDVWGDGTSSHVRVVRQSFDWQACADRVISRGYICAGCQFSGKCKILSRFVNYGLIKESCHG